MTVLGKYAPELVADFYAFTMSASYFQEGMFEDATFSLFIREYPPHRAFFVSAGINYLVEIITQSRFSKESLRYLHSLKLFSSEFLDYLKRFRFTGTIRAIPEGRIFFSQEPVLEVTAPIIEGQLLETLVINLIQLETMIASKAVRCIHAAKGRRLIDFSLRRTQGVDAGMAAARASYLAGFMGTSNVLAGKIHGIPVFGTMAHSYVTSFNHEMDAFLAFVEVFPDNTVLLIDTYDTLCGAQKAVEVAHLLKARGKHLIGVRLDSGNLVELSKEVRRIFNLANLPDVQIMASGNLDEFRIAELVEAGAEIDTFAVGTRMGVSADAPYLDIAYKLVEYADRPILKLSAGKKTWVSRKQVYRYYGGDGKMREDCICLLSEVRSGADPLLEVVVAGGERRNAPESLEGARKRLAEDRKALPSDYQELRPAKTYPVRISEFLRELDLRITQEKERQEISQSCGPRATV